MKETYEVGAGKTVVVTIEVTDERVSNYPSELDWAAVRAERDALKEKVARQEAELRRRASAHKVLENRYETLLATLDETEDSRDARDRLLAAATTRISHATALLNTSAVRAARDHTITRDGAALADAIGNALRALEG